MKVWISKYALTQGIFEIEGEISRYESGYFSGKDDDALFRGLQWHMTKELAITEAEYMREKEIESLKNRIIKLENMEF